MANSFGAKAELQVGRRSYEIFRIDALQASRFDVARLPFCLKVLLENLLRHEDGGEAIRAADIEALATWNASAEPSDEIAFTPARVVATQDFTGVPAIVDLAAMRDAMKAMGGDANRINPLVPAELVIDHLGPGRHVRDRGAGVPAQRRASSSSATRSATLFLRWGARARSTTSRSCRPTPASCTR